MFIFFFFFSSRRRHTRFDCDWSSDVCSSDLTHFKITLLFGDDLMYFSVFALYINGPSFQIAEYIVRSEEHTSELQSQSNLVCRLLLEKKKKKKNTTNFKQ